MRFSVVTALLMLAGCAFHTKPYVAYEGSHQLSNTSVLSVGAGDGNSLAGIAKADGKGTSCAQAGCPYWVRVLPGKHTFQISYKIFDNGIASHRVGETELTLDDMKPKHVYEVRFEATADKSGFRATATDLGENPEYGITLGLKGANQKYHRVSFEDE